MEKESQSARQQDTNKMKEGLRDFFVQDDVEVPPVPRDKTGRGFNHLGTARALCPRAYIYEFDNDSGYVSNLLFCLLKLCFSFLEKITSGNIEITADQFPNFLYDEHNADQPSEEEEWDVEYGLLCSPLCLWVRRSVFLSRFELVLIFTVLQIHFHGERVLVTFGEEKESRGR
jgi:hypothetical protein